MIRAMVVFNATAAETGLSVIRFVLPDERRLRAIYPITDPPEPEERTVKVASAQQDNPVMLTVRAAVAEATVTPPITRDEAQEPVVAEVEYTPMARTRYVRPATNVSAGTLNEPLEITVATVAVMAAEFDIAE